MGKPDSVEIGGATPQRRAERALYLLGPDGGRRVILPAGPAEDPRTPVMLGYAGTEYQLRIRPVPVRITAAIVLVALFAAGCLGTTWAWLWIWR